MTVDHDKFVKWGCRSLEAFTTDQKAWLEDEVTSAMGLVAMQRNLSAKTQRKLSAILEVVRGKKTMPTFSSASLKKLDTCHPDLQHLMQEAILSYDLKVLCGHRTKQEQEAAHAAGASKLQWPESKHNRVPSEAVDVVPYPVVWPDARTSTYIKDLARFYLMGGYVLGVAHGLGLRVRWGGDWDRDFDVSDQVFDDLCHFELVG